MKITGKWRKRGSFFMLRQTSKPSMPSMTASRRITSGVAFWRASKAAGPEDATRTVIPAPSSASTRKRSVSGESSTASTVVGISALSIMGGQRLQIRHVALQVDVADIGAQACCESTRFGTDLIEIVKLHLDGANVPGPSKPDQLG